MEGNSFGHYSKGSNNGPSLRRPKRPASPINQPTTIESSPYPPLVLGNTTGNDQHEVGNTSASVMKKYLSLEMQLRGERQATQLRAIAEFASLFDAHPSPNLVNSGLLKLAELFYILGNGPRMMICQTFHAAQPHLPMLTSLELVINQIGSLATSNDYLARSLCLRTLSVMSQQLSDRLDIHYLILKGLEAEEELEQTTSLEFASIMAQYSFDFAKTVLPKLESLLKPSLHPRISCRVVAALRTLRNHVELASQAREICLKLLVEESLSNVALAQNLLDSSTYLSVTDIDMASEQVKKLFEFLTKPLSGLPEGPIRQSILASVQQIVQAQHSLPPSYFDQLITLTQEPTCSPLEKTQILMIIKFAVEQESVLGNLSLQMDTPPLPLLSQIFYRVIGENKDLSIEPLPMVSSLLGILLEQLQLPFTNNSNKMETENQQPPTFPRIILAAQIVRSIVFKVPSGPVCNYLLHLSILRLWLLLATRELSSSKLRVLLDTLAGLLASWISLNPPPISDTEQLPFSLAGRLDVDILLATLHLIRHVRSQTSENQVETSSAQTSLSSVILSQDKIQLICTWVIVYASTYLTSKPRPGSLSSEVLIPFMNEPDLLVPLVCLSVHMSLPSESWLVDQMKKILPIKEKYASLGAMACYAHRTAHHELATLLFPEIIPRVYMDTTGTFLKGLYAWSQGESKLNLLLASYKESPDSDWVAEISSTVSALYQAGTFFQAWSAASEHSSPFPSWWVQLRAEILSTIRAILGIVIMTSGRAPTKFHLNLLTRKVSSLIDARRKARFIKRRFYHLDSLTQDSLDDLQLQLTTLIALIVHHFPIKVDTSGSLTELALLTESDSIERPGHKLALSIFGLTESTQQPNLVLWQAIVQFLKHPHPSPPAIYHSNDSYHIDLTMDPIGSSLSIAEGTIFKFTGSARKNLHFPLKSFVPPSKIRIQLYTDPLPHHDLLYNLDSQIDHPKDVYAGWVNEVPLSPEGNFHVTAALPPHLNFISGHLHVTCSLFHPIKRQYYYTGPTFSLPIV